MYGQAAEHNLHSYKRPKGSSFPEHSPELLKLHPQSKEDATKELLKAVHSRTGVAVNSLLRGELPMEQKRALIRDSYLTDDAAPYLDSRSDDIAAYHQKLVENNQIDSDKPVFSTFNHILNYTVRGEEDINFRYPVSETIQRLEWTTMREDFKAWGKAVKELAATSDLDDQTFRSEAASRISSLLLNESPLFKHLASGDIAVTRTHSELKKTPFIHTFDVLMAIDTSVCTSAQQRFFLRLIATFHDIGKAIVAQYDYLQNHAAFSQSMLMEFMMSEWKMSPLEAYRFTNVVRLHHASELMEKDRQVLTNEDVLGKLYELHDVLLGSEPIEPAQFQFTAAALWELGNADTQSVMTWEYSQKTVLAGIDNINLILATAENEAVFRKHANVLIPWLAKFAEDGLRYIEKLNKTSVDLEAKLESLVKFLQEIIKGISELQPQALLELLSNLSDTPKDIEDTKLALAA